MNSVALLEFFNSAMGEEIFASLYGSQGVPAARKRYGALVEGLGEIGRAPVRDHRGRVVPGFPELQRALRLFSAPGRTELGGNHTDHNRGKVLAASIHLDAAAVAAPRSDSWVIFRSTGYPDAVVDLTDLAPRREERGTTEALIRGIAAEFAKRGVPVRGFTANGDSTVLTGSGLSSSAAMEVLFGRIFDCLFGPGTMPALEIAQMGQKAENDYFGKPSGLMDQIACASGGAVAIDFEDPRTPKVIPLTVDFGSLGYTLCVVDTRGSHADLTADYAAIPEEMGEVARFFGKTVLRELNRRTVMERAAELRKTLGDRPLLRALHFFDENNRVDAMGEALERMHKSLDLKERQAALGRYLELVNQSGNSSWSLLQNIYSPRNVEEQGISLALALSRNLFSHTGASRVHGGGFAGTIQAYIPTTSLDSYREAMDAVFGAGSVTPLRIRRAGSIALSLTL